MTGHRWGVDTAAGQPSTNGCRGYCGPAGSLPAQIAGTVCLCVVIQIRISSCPKPERVLLSRVQDVAVRVVRRRSSHGRQQRRISMWPYSGDVQAVVIGGRPELLRRPDRDGSAESTRPGCNIQVRSRWGLSGSSLSKGVALVWIHPIVDRQPGCRRGPRGHPTSGRSGRHDARNDRAGSA